MQADSSVIDKQALTALLQEAYTIDVSHLTFVPKGEESYSYIATASDGRKYFVKVHLASTSPALEACYNFVHHLRAREGFEWAVGPYRTFDGKPLGNLGEYAVAVFDYVTGITRTPAELAGLQVQQLVVLVVHLHRAVASGLASGLPQEDYAIPFRAWLMDVLEAVDQPLRTDNAWAKRAYDLLRTEKGQILSLLAHVGEIASGVQAGDHELAVTHGDLASHNIIQNEQRALFLIDWGKLRIAPAARDLVDLWEEGNAPLLSAYLGAAGSSTTLSRQVVTYYLYHNLLATITDYGSWLILEQAGQEEADHAWNRLRQVLPIDLKGLQAKVEVICRVAVNEPQVQRANDHES
jgi:hypothetical protein